MFVQDGCDTRDKTLFLLFKAVYLQPDGGDVERWSGVCAMAPSLNLRDWLW